MEDDKSKLLNVREAADLLRISPGSLYHWLSDTSRGIPVIRFSRRCVRFRLSDLENWIAEKLVAAEGTHRRGSGGRK